MDNTRTSSGVVYIGELELTRLLVQLIKHYKFAHANEYPEKIVLPTIREIEGVIIEQEVKDAASSGKPKKG